MNCYEVAMLCKYSEIRVEAVHPKKGYPIILYRKTYDDWTNSYYHNDKAWGKNLLALNELKDVTPLQITTGFEDDKLSCWIMAEWQDRFSELYETEMTRQAEWGIDPDNPYEEAHVVMKPIE